jgi:hypothetical protein
LAVADHNPEWVISHDESAAMTADPPVTIPLDADGRPDLQALVERAGRRHAASIGEQYVEDDFTRPPHQGGYQHITPEEWAAWDHAMADWQARRLVELPKPRARR